MPGVCVSVVPRCSIEYLNRVIRSACRNIATCRGNALPVGRPRYSIYRLSMTLIDQEHISLICVPDLDSHPRTRQFDCHRETRQHLVQLHYDHEKLRIAYLSGVPIPEL